MVKLLLLLAVIAFAIPVIALVLGEISVSAILALLGVGLALWCSTELLPPRANA